MDVGIPILSTLTFQIKETMIDQIIEYNKTFVAQKGNETHPLVPKDIVVHGFIINSETGKLEEIA